MWVVKIHNAKCVCETLEAFGIKVDGEYRSEDGYKRSNLPLKSCKSRMTLSRDGSCDDRSV